MSNDPSAQMHRERNYTGVKDAQREKPPGEGNVTDVGNLKAEPTTWNPQVVDAGGYVDPMYHQPRITSTMVQDPISAIKEQIFLSPLHDGGAQIKAQVQVPPPRPPAYDEQGNQINPWDNLSKDRPTMQVVNPGGLAPHGAHAVGAPPQATVPTRTKNATIAPVPTSENTRMSSPSVASRMEAAAPKPTYDLPWLGVDKAKEPNKSVAFKTDIGMHAAYYHEVIVTDRIIILAYDTRYRGTLFIPTAPARGQTTELTISYAGREYLTYNIGGIFETGCLTCLMLLRSPSEYENEEATTMSDPFSGQAAALIDSEED